jgi:signal transduction histidine kinase/DNA-binding NarL/FixJ family response regulator
VLVGWAVDVPLLKSVLPGAVEMKANTAVGLVLAACALFILGNRPSPPIRYVGQALALAVAALGLATFGQYAFGWELRIDELLFRDTGNAYNVIRGRMSPYSTLAFACIGLALAALPRPNLRPLTSFGAIAAIAIGAVSFLGYLWNARELMTDRWLPPVAVHTALAFMLLGAGTFLTARTSMQQLTARGASVELRVLTGFVGALALLFAAASYTYWTGARFADSARQVTHTQEVRAALGALYGAISDAESAQRNYLLTGIPGHKQEYTRFVAEIDRREDSLAKLIADNATQLQNLAELRKFIDLRMDALARHISLYERADMRTVQAAIAGDIGIPAMRSIRELVARMDNVEKALMSERDAAFGRTRELTLIALLATLAIATAILIFLFRDIRREVAVRAQAEDDARQANAAKDSFLATMSHEIRTPLNGMLGMLELLGMSRLDEEQRESLTAAQDSGRGLVRIIDDVLDHAKIEAGKLEIRLEPASIAQVVRRIVTTYYAVASAKDLTLSDRVDPRISPALLADALRVSQILGNFVSNAIKFTERGFIEVRVDLVEKAGDAETVRFSVKDSGIGIAPEAQKRLFQPFEQAGSETSRMYGGTGLGLAISRRLAEMMGGTIAMESKQGEGTTMSLTLTLPISEAPSHERTGAVAPFITGSPSPIAAASADGPLVLAVDDHPINRRLLERQLGVLGMRVHTAQSGEEALARWHSGAFDLVITDCNMPDMDGYALARAIREIEAEEGRPRRTPIIAWTANVLAGAAAQCRAAGMDDMLSKPADLTQLKEVLSRWLPGGVIAIGRPIDLSELKKIATDPAERKEILLDFLAQTQSDCVALEAALEKQDLHELGRIAHRMKGASRIVGARELAFACETMEKAARQGGAQAARAAKAALDGALERLAAYRAEAADSSMEQK